MQRSSLSLFCTGLFLVSISAWAQNACDLNNDGVVNAVDVQSAINMSLGQATCAANVAGTNVCNVIVVQRVISASLGGPCLTSTGLHSVILNWAASTSSNVAGYKVYRSTTSGGPYTLLTTLGNVTTISDNTVLSGQTYYYVMTAVDSSNNESSYSTQSQAIIPVP
jgi:hypothetical protein